MRRNINLMATAAVAAFLQTIATLAEAVSCSMAAPVSSGARTVSVVELYTSEGCDSCPPADKWFSTLSYKRNDVLPLAFHVDYWDYIGWKDPFGKPAYAERQRATVTRQGSRTVYTPQVMLDGKDARAWTFNSKFDAGLRDLAARPARASLTLATTLPATSPGTIEVAVNVSIPDAALRNDAALFIAVTESNLQSRVTAGENRGNTLKHNHVVRELIGPIPIRVAGAIDIRRSVDIAASWKRADINVAGFVQNLRSGEVLQALSAPLCGL